MKFSELPLNDQVLDALEAMRFDECTPIQEKSIPVILEGRDLIAVAQTGTGKTAAYLLPILNKLSEGGHPEDAINCIIMSPTRELAQQIDQQMEGFSYFMPVSSVAVYAAAGHFIPVNLVVLQYGINLFFSFFEFTGLYGSLQIHQIPVEVMPYHSCLLIGCFPFCRLFVAQSYLLFIGKVSFFCFLLASQLVIYVKGNIVYHDHEYGGYQKESIPLILTR